MRYDVVLLYAHGGVLTPKEQEKRERVRLLAAERFARGEKTEVVARALRVTSRSVRRWRREWEQGGADALRSKGSASVERLSSGQWEWLERELKRGGGPRAEAAEGTHVGTARSPAVVRVRGRSRGRVNIAGVVCYSAGHRSRFFFKLAIWHGRQGEPKASPGASTAI
ncbi:helix-turn-helix domain containing protein [Streptomyces neyagawaensis]|nr:helix-turn-helix domain-containing protein [Streptomyces neyagawaensis]MCL6737637.1 helix-turn-helix domain-containing protein [Streptomyces neyagawaensis]MDE1682991.1 helix-turn-helix domain containing protein [Streptomyces neyagawaensis]